MKAFGFIVLLCLTVGLTKAVRIKVHLVKESVERYHAHVLKRQTQDTACSDVVVVNRSSLTLPGRLDELNDRVRFYRSEIARNNLNMFQDITEVPLANFSRTFLREVLDVLRNNSCLPFFFGGAVRDQFLGASPRDADLEIDCSIERFFNVCISTWGEVNCGRSVSRPLGHIGLTDSKLQNVDLASTDITFYASLSDLEYTANSMAYDLNGLNVLIDLPGTGEMDVCNKSIRIPSEDDSLASWKDWVTDRVLLRFWKLRIKGFTAFNAATLQFVTNHSMDLLRRKPDSFGSFYCDNAYSENDYISADRRCDASAAVCEAGQGKAKLYDAAFAEDFGDFWTNVIEPDLLPTCGGWALSYSFGVVFALMMVGFMLVA